MIERLGTERRFRDMREYQFKMADFDLSRLAAAWFIFWSGNMSLRAADFWAVGAFDENFQSWGAEDIELGYRLTERGIPIELSRDGWSVELPHERDVNNDLTSRHNMQLVLDKHRAPLVEICAYVFLTGQPVMIEDACGPFLSWARRSRRLDVLAEIQAAVAPAGAVPRRVAVLGCGGAVPASWATDGSSYTLLDFDRDLLSRAQAPGHAGLYAIGLRTGLPDKAFDLVVISSRLRGLWELWGISLLAEAHRIGHEVRVPFRQPSLNPHPTVGMRVPSGVPHRQIPSGDIA